MIRPTIVPGVDVIPASIDDGFVASQWKELVEEHLPGQNQYEILRRNIIDRVADDYDFIFIDTGPHRIRSCSTVWRPAICCLPLPHQPRLTSTQH